jgi:hypothetical protein
VHQTGLSADIACSLERGHEGQYEMTGFAKVMTHVVDFYCDALRDVLI